MRDSQRSKVYEAERVAFPVQFEPKHRYPKLTLTLDECKVQVDKIWHSKWRK